MNTKTKNNQWGFTAVEVLMVIGIFSLLAGLGLFISMDFYRSYSFRSDRDMTISILERARAQSLANINESAHGVRFDSGSSKLILFQGNSYDDRDTSLDQEISLNSGIAVTGINEVVFEQLTGNAVYSGAGNMILSYGAQTATISFNGEGRINY
ncbi:MAG: prepilin-type N-terminal cleavage/methylation domain-containing protein [bacterium]|nr:prepilin-type N-terminal cleavage/methylation domain-containing protein [bacterium]